MNTTLLRKLKTPSIFKRVSSNFVENQLNSRKQQLWPNGYFLFSPNTGFHGTRRAPQTSEESEASSDSEVFKIPRAVKKEAQAVLLEYFHATRSLQFLDAENMSKNSPIFLSKLLKRVGISQANIGPSISRFLCFNPISEFEPFLESLGLKPSEYVALLPPHLTFLSEARSLLENYYLLCNFGFERRKLGKVYKEATEVFYSDVRVLMSKLRAYEELGIDRLSLVKFIISSPYLLIGDDGNVNADFVAVLERFKDLGLEISWIEGNLLEGSSCNWSHMLGLLNFISEIGLSNDQLVEMIRNHPDFLFEDSGNRMISLVGFLLKFGFTMDRIQDLLMQFPYIKVGKFVSNLRRSFLFLNEIEMGVSGIGDFVTCHTLLMGACTLKRTNSLLKFLCVGKKRLCSYVLENPQELINFVIGAKIKPLPKLEECIMSKMLKSKFLLELGFKEESDEMKKARKVFRGKGGELQERFDCIMSHGLERKEVCRMVKVAPQILNQKKKVIKTKIDFLVRELGYPISSLGVFPSFLNYTVERAKLRLYMYNWIKGHGIANLNLSLSTIVASTETEFLKLCVNRHPSGPQVWQDLKEKIYSK